MYGWSAGRLRSCVKFLRASSWRPTLMSHRGDSLAKKERVKMMPANIRCMLLGTNHCVSVLLEMWMDDPHEAKYASMMPRYTAPENAVTQSPRMARGAVSAKYVGATTVVWPIPFSKSVNCSEIRVFGYTEMLSWQRKATTLVPKSYVPIPAMNRPA